MKNIALLLTTILTLTGCSIAPSPINYGADGCHFCKMTIVDNQHAAQIVTEKGRAFKYDAIECMMNHLADWQEPKAAILLVANYDAPGELIDATQASYLISESIPSPMGHFLTGFEKSESRDQRVGDGDQSLNWEELQSEFLME